MDANVRDFGVDMNELTFNPSFSSMPLDNEPGAQSQNGPGTAEVAGT